MDQGQHGMSSNGISPFALRATTGGSVPTRTEVRIERELSPWQRASQELKCDHPPDQVRITVKVASNGIKHYRNQCLECGESIAAIKKGTVPGSQLCRAIPFDETIRDKRFERLRERAKELEQEKRESWFDQYSDYLRTAEWQAKRKAVLERDKYVCQGCLVNRAVQAHHLTYAHVGNELLFELIAVCMECHRRIHP